ncbi:hypothetical protein [Chryseobacterium sp. FH1]|uniref:hypothetical protein n=1 Tax=Chryseobacterium sp. FH1 TaxID=1233951 RepID=UPI0004E337C6|nr:hypothetical protein [Chryseobacterium sp. FH1]KFC20215.1 hypothetical protein IO90_13585 [Chryseobacterium sp. FH1]
MTDKQKALEKIRIELNKDIDNICEISKNCNFLELLYFVYQLHWVRLLRHFPNAENVNPEVISTYSNSLEESLKYLISLSAKFGKWRIAISKEDNGPILNLPLAQFLIKDANLINSKYETEALIKLFDIRVSGERNQHVRIDMSNAEKDKDVKKLFDYFLRIDEDNNIKKKSKKNLDGLLKNFEEEYLPYADLFFLEMGVEIVDFTYFIRKTLEDLSERILKTSDKFDKSDNGNIEVNSSNTFMHFSNCYVINKQRFLDSFDRKFDLLLNRLAFDYESFNPKELKFHQLTRQPFLIKNNTLVISPELIMDSLFTNIHYSLIEATNIKHEYITRQASQFLDKISLISQKYGYVEVDREFDLFEKKNQIGDIDIILKNTNNEYLLIEAKNHALPLDVYFKDTNKTNEHLKYLQSSWEKKVLRRAYHLQIHHSKYNIPKTYKYIVVSRFPEIISHYSQTLILSIQEFDDWLNKYDTIENFDEFNEKYYNNVGLKFSTDELKEMQNANLFLGRFEKE